MVFNLFKKSFHMKAFSCCFRWMFAISESAFHSKNHLLQRISNINAFSFNRRMKWFRLSALSFEWAAFLFHSVEHNPLWSFAQMYRTFTFTNFLPLKREYIIIMVLWLLNEPTESAIHRDACAHCIPYKRISFFRLFPVWYEPWFLCVSIQMH